MKTGKLAILAAMLLTACAKKEPNKEPYREFYCTASHIDVTYLSVVVENKDGQTKTKLTPIYSEICDYGYFACTTDGQIVDEKACVK